MARFPFVTPEYTDFGDRYGMVLAKEKNDKKALGYFLQSVHKFPMNWGCWLEITSLASRVEDVRILISRHANDANTNVV